LTIPDRPWFPVFLKIARAGLIAFGDALAAQPIGEISERHKRQVTAGLQGNGAARGVGDQKFRVE